MYKFGSVFLMLVFAAAVSAQAQVSDDKGAAGDRPLVVKKKPAASYTALARRNGISGKVMLKVEFRADGTIGDVTEMDSNSPDVRNTGLVKSAIGAARRIKFEPAVKNGRPVTVLRRIEYSFSVY